MVEHQLPKLRAEGSIPFTRSRNIKASTIGGFFPLTEHRGTVSVKVKGKCKLSYILLCRLSRQNTE